MASPRINFRLSEDNERSLRKAVRELFGRRRKKVPHGWHSKVMNEALLQYLANYTTTR